MKMGMDIVAKRKCPCPLWGLKIRANEGRGQTCLDYAKCSRIWRNSKKHKVFFAGDKTMTGGRSPPPLRAVKIAQRF